MTIANFLENYCLRIISVLLFKSYSNRFKCIFSLEAFEQERSIWISRTGTLASKNESSCQISKCFYLQSFAHLTKWHTDQHTIYTKCARVFVCMTKESLGPRGSLAALLSWDKSRQALRPSVVSFQHAHKGRIAFKTCQLRSIKHDRSSPL